MNVDDEFNVWLEANAQEIAEFTNGLEQDMAEKKLLPGRERGCVMGMIVAHAVEHIGIDAVVDIAKRVADVLKKMESPCQN